VNPSPFVAAIRESNRQARDAWKRWAPHREHVMALLAEAAGPARSLCILGAGQLNDVRLPELLRRYAEVNLVDLDIETVESALARHGFARSRACRVHGPVDLTGVLDRLPRAAGRLPGARSGDDAEQLLEVLAAHCCDVPGQPFDVTASLGVLTQLAQSVVDAALGAGGAPRVSVALRDKHLRDLVRLTRPGGTLILVTDVVATTTAPSLRAAAGGDLERQMAGLVADRNFFTGANPYRIAAVLEEDERFGAALSRVRLVAPWLWAVTGDREHLTCAIVAERRS
jgi:hypothetical protein